MYTYITFLDLEILNDFLVNSGGIGEGENTSASGGIGNNGDSNSNGGPNNSDNNFTHHKDSNNEDYYCTDCNQYHDENSSCEAGCADTCGCSHNGTDNCNCDHLLQDLDQENLDRSIKCCDCGGS
jgi:hypothetical protein